MRLASECATEVVDVPLHRVQTQNEATSDLAVRCSLKQQPQHVALTLGERFRKLTGVSRREREI